MKAAGHAPAVLLICATMVIARPGLTFPEVSSQGPEAIGGLTSTDFKVRTRAISAAVKRGGPAEAAALIAALRHEDKGVRRDAARALGEIGNPVALEPLIEMLEDEDKWMRRWAASALGALGHPGAVPALIAAFGDRAYEVRNGAVEALVQIGEPAVTALLEAMKGEAEDRRYMAVRTLGEMRHTRGFEPLLQALEDPSPKVRARAASSLGSYGDAGAVDFLIGAMSDESALVRQFAAEALGTLKDARAVRPLLVALEDKEDPVWRAARRALGRIGSPSVEPLISSPGTSPEIRARKAEVLVIIGDPRAIPHLHNLLQSGNTRVRAATVRGGGNWGKAESDKDLIRLYSTALKDEVPEVRRAAIENLGRLTEYVEAGLFLEALGDGDAEVRRKANYALRSYGKSALKLLKTAADSADPNVRKGVIEVMGNMRDPSTAPIFAHALDDPDVQVRRLAIQGLEGLRGKSPRAPLVAALDDHDAEVRKSAVRALKRAGGEGALESLSEALRDDHPAVRRTAVEALREVGDRRHVDGVVALLDDEDRDVQAQAARTLGTLGEARAVEPLIAALRGESGLVRRSALDSLRSLAGDPAAFIEILQENKVQFIHDPFKKGECTSCHESHASDYTGFLKQEPTRLCYGCHKEIGSRIVASRHKHRPVEENFCSGCHFPHDGPFPGLLRHYYPAEYYLEFKLENYDLCWQCHNRDIVLLERTESLTAFRNGPRNLHFVHVNQTKGRSCRSCHNAHATDQERLVRSGRIPFAGGMRLPIEFTPLPTGGNCVVGCHREMTYDREHPVRY